MLGSWQNAELVLGDLPWYARHVRRLPGKSIFIGTEEVDECSFLFGIQLRADLHLLFSRPLGVERELLDALCGFEGANLAVGVGSRLEGLRPDQSELLGCEDCLGEIAATHLALIHALES